MVVRIRIPGGRVTVKQLAGLGELAGEFGRPEVQLTSRANVQLRGIETDRLEDLGRAVAELGLLPSPDHERARNIVASPFAGIGDRLPLDDLITQLDRALCAEPELVELPGRFLFALDDGSGDLSSGHFDLALRRFTADTALVMIGTAGEPVGSVVRLAEAIPTMITIARRFVTLRRGPATTGWHLRETDPRLIADRMRPVSELVAVTDAVDQAPVGAVDGAASVVVPLARLSAPQLAALVAAASVAADGGSDARLILTPWRGVVIPGAESELSPLAAAGLIIEQSSAWNRLTACVGSPGCARSAIDTRRTATELVALLDALPAATEPRPERIHLSGCDRRCGRPAGEVADLIAPREARAALLELGGARPADQTGRT